MFRDVRDSAPFFLPLNPGRKGFGLGGLSLLIHPSEKGPQTLVVMQWQLPVLLHLLFHDAPEPGPSIPESPKRPVCVGIVSSLLLL